MSVEVSKLTGHVVLAQPSNAVIVSKLTGYVVMAPAATVSRRPVVNCCT